MPKPQLIEYIQQQLEQGFSSDAIAEALVSQGWEVEEVQDAFDYFISVEEATSEPSGIQAMVSSYFDSLPTDKRLMVVGSVLVGVLIVIVLIYFTLQGFLLGSSSTRANDPGGQIERTEPISVTSTSTTEFVPDGILGVDESVPKPVVDESESKPEESNKTSQEQSGYENPESVSSIFKTKPDEGTCYGSVQPSYGLTIIQDDKYYSEWTKNFIKGCEDKDLIDIDFDQKILLGESHNYCNQDTYYIEKDDKNKTIYFVTKHNSVPACEGMGFVMDWLVIDRPPSDYTFESKFVK